MRFTCRALWSDTRQDPERMNKNSAEVLLSPTESHSQRLADKSSVDLWLNKKSSEIEVLGAIIHVQPDSYNPKRDFVTCTRVSPTERHKYISDLLSGEKLCGEYYTLTTNKRVLKNGIILLLPCAMPKYPELQELKLRVKFKDDVTWDYSSYGITLKGEDKVPFLEVQVTRCATYVPTVVPKREVFTVTDQGLLYNARLSRYITVRFPKKCIDCAQHDYYIEVHPLKKEKESEARRDFPEEMAPFESISDSFDIFGPQMQFKRPLGLKLGIPLVRDLELEYLANTVIVLRKSSDDSWCTVDESLKFTKTTVSFTTKELGRFVVAIVEPAKKLWLRKYMPLIERINMTTKCEVLVFTRFDKKVWSVWIELVRINDASAAVERRERAGMCCINRPRRVDSASALDDESYLDGRLSARRRRSANKDTALSLEDSVVTFWVEISGDVKVTESDEAGISRRHELLFCDSLEENYRLFDVEPAETMFASGATGLVRIYEEQRSTQPEKTKRSMDCVRTFEFAINQRQVEDYFYVEPAPGAEVAVTEMKMEVDESPEPPERASVEPVKSPKPSGRVERARQREVTTVNLMRLTESKRAKTKVDREPKVLSGRSLMTLSRRVEEGLTLAVYLDIPDSTITGIGFDALANGLTLQEVTYKILLLWKRRGGLGGQAKVEQLVGALKAMGRLDIVTLLWEHHIRNEELTPASFIPSVGDDAS